MAVAFCIQRDSFGLSHAMWRSFKEGDPKIKIVIQFSWNLLLEGGNYVMKISVKLVFFGLQSAYINESYHSSTLSVDCPCIVDHGPIFSLGCT